MPIDSLAVLMLVRIHHQIILLLARNPSLMAKYENQRNRVENSSVESVFLPFRLYYCRVHKMLAPSLTKTKDRIQYQHSVTFIYNERGKDHAKPFSCCEEEYIEWKVRQILDKSLKKSLFRVTNKRDQGTAFLQVAIKSGHLALQTYSLIEEQILTLLKSRQSPFCQPVLQTAGGRAVLTQKHTDQTLNGQYEMCIRLRKRLTGFAFSRKCWKLYADISQRDSYGGTLLQPFDRTMKCCHLYYW